MQRIIPILVLLCATLHAQVAERDYSSYGGSEPVITASVAAESSSRDTKIEPSPFSPPDVRPIRIGFDWQAASNQSFVFLGIEHALRMSQRKTRREFGGPFFEDYRNAVSGLGGWGDGDSIFTNYVAHPMQGAVTGYIQIQNDPGGRKLEFGGAPEYWKSRTKAMAWAALYSTQFELGLFSEAAFGNVGKKRGTMGFVDLVMTPVGGMGLIVAEDAIDKRWIEGLEQRTDSLNRRRLYRMFLNPQRTFANVLRLKKPWYRDTRSIDWDPEDLFPSGAATPSSSRPGSVLRSSD